MGIQSTFLRRGRFGERPFNDALAEVLSTKRVAWSENRAVISQMTDVLLGAPAEEPDVLIQPLGSNPVVIEVKVNSDPEPDARGRVGKRTTLGKIIYTAIALRVPGTVRNWSNHGEAVAKISGFDGNSNDALVMQFAVLQQGANGAIERQPRDGFFEGSVDDLVELCETSATPQHMIATFADRVAEEIAVRADAMRSELTHEQAEEIALSIGQNTVAHGLRLACCIWMSTLRLHELLASSPELRTRGLKSLGEIRQQSLSRDSLPLAEIRNAWRLILEYNYGSVVRPALQALVPSIPEMLGSDTLDELARLAVQVTDEGLGEHVDFAGELFPKLLDDRKETAANYTLPTTASLLAKLAVDRIPIDDWSSDDVVSRMRIADFACGTGTLLRAAYQRMRKNYESAGGTNVGSLHQRMMEEGITGTDINPLAAHMTAAGLSTVQINQNYRTTNIGSLPVKGGKTGALEFLVSEQATDILAESVEQSSSDEIGASLSALNRSYSLVIQNPPYTRGQGDRKMLGIIWLTTQLAFLPGI